MLICNIPTIPYVYTEVINCSHVEWQIVGGELVDSDFSRLLEGSSLVSIYPEKNISAIVLKDKKFYKILLASEKYFCTDNINIAEIIQNYPPKILEKQQYLIPLMTLNIVEDENENYVLEATNLLYQDIIITNVKGYHLLENGSGLELYQFNIEEKKWIVYKCILLPHKLDLTIKYLNSHNIFEGVEIDNDFLDYYN